jgi:hypothetical protein
LRDGHAGGDYQRCYYSSVHGFLLWVIGPGSPRPALRPVYMTNGNPREAR